MQVSALNKLFVASVLAASMVGCASDGGVTEDAAMVDESQTQEVAQSPEMDSVSNEDAAMSNPLLDQTTVYFAYDGVAILPEFKDVLNAHAEFLVANPQSTITFEGHCDERGTTEYNLALGERRANTVKSYLIVQGVNPTQLESVSFGEERPASFGSDEMTWSKNRRAEIKYNTAVSQNEF